MPSSFTGKPISARYSGGYSTDCDAFRADRAHEPLRDERFHDRGEQERLDIHIEQTSDAADCVVRVQRAENKMASHGSANGDVRRLDVANFTDHDDVRVLPQNVTQTLCEGEIDLWFHVNLRDAQASGIPPVLRW